MYELKTLKDISFGCSTKIVSDLLKKEAIKWVKSKHCMNFVTSFDSDLFSNASEVMGAMKMLKYFFNITEEDIQNKEV